MKTFEIKENPIYCSNVAVINNIGDNFAQVNSDSIILKNNNLFDDMVKTMAKIDKEIWHDALPGNQWIFGGSNYIFHIEQTQLNIFKKENKQVIVEK